MAINDSNFFTVCRLKTLCASYWIGAMGQCGLLPLHRVDPLSLRMLFSDEEEGEETWVVPVNNIPGDWKAGETYDSGVQVNQ